MAPDINSMANWSTDGYAGNQTTQDGYEIPGEFEPILLHNRPRSIPIPCCRHIGVQPATRPGHEERHSVDQNHYHSEPMNPGFYLERHAAGLYNMSPKHAGLWPLIRKNTPISGCWVLRCSGSSIANRGFHFSPYPRIHIPLRNV